MHCASRKQEAPSKPHGISPIGPTTLCSGATRSLFSPVTLPAALPATPSREIFRKAFDTSGFFSASLSRKRGLFWRLSLLFSLLAGSAAVTDQFGKTAQLLPEAKDGVSLNDVGRHPPTAAPRDGSKLALLRRADGATIVDLTQATGWLAHTTRAASTGLRKRGYAVTRERIGAGESVYRISGAPAGSGDRVVQTEAVDGRRDPKRKTKRAA